MCSREGQMNSFPRSWSKHWVEWMIKIIDCPTLFAQITWKELQRLDTNHNNNVFTDPVQIENWISLKQIICFSDVINFTAQLIFSIFRWDPVVESRIKITRYGMICVYCDLSRVPGVYHQGQQCHSTSWERNQWSEVTTLSDTHLEVDSPGSLH